MGQHNLNFTQLAGNSLPACASCSAFIVAFAVQIIIVSWPLSGAGHLEWAERLERMRDPAVTAQILSEESIDPSPEWKSFTRAVDEMYEFGDPPNYSPTPEEALRVHAAEMGLSALELSYDLLVQGDGRTILFAPAANFSWQTLDALLEMTRNPNSLIGLGDGGPHMGLVCDASVPTHLLTYWTRDRDGERIRLGEAIRKLTSANAAAIGLDDRGVIAAGYRADINVIDYDKLTLPAPSPEHDLPANGMRLKQDARGYPHDRNDRPSISLATLRLFSTAPHACRICYIDVVERRPATKGQLVFNAFYKRCSGTWR